jgi:hypothetical protein
MKKALLVLSLVATPLFAACVGAPDDDIEAPALPVEEDVAEAEQALEYICFDWSAWYYTSGWYCDGLFGCGPDDDLPPRTRNRERYRWCTDNPSNPPAGNWWQEFDHSKYVYGCCAQ